MSETLLEVREIATGYTEPVVGPVSFCIESGQVLGLAGPNGSGKSTILKAIGDNARIFEGELLRKPWLTLSWMEQQPVRLTEMPFSGWEYLRYAEADAEDPPQQLLGWLDQRIDSLSGGQFQLLRCWSVLGSQAQLVMLDEPTNNLDVQSEKTLIEILSAEHGQRGVLLVSHDGHFLERVCDRVLNVCP